MFVYSRPRNIGDVFVCRSTMLHWRLISVVTRISIRVVSCRNVTVVRRTNQVNFMQCANCTSTRCKAFCLAIQKSCGKRKRKMLPELPGLGLYYSKMFQIINNYRTRLRKISLIVSGEQIKNLPKPKVRQITDLRDKSRYFAMTDFNNWFMIRSPSLFS